MERDNTKELLSNVINQMVDSVKTVSEVLDSARTDLNQYGIDSRRIDSIRNLLNLAAYDISGMEKNVK
ncbi:MAG: hypothetical protein IIZ94_06740 [Prevotella sp.]|nr:hypothetical protein [Prevotella sp.]